MHLTSYLQNGVLTIVLTGEIDHHSAKQYIQSITSKIEAYKPQICVLDYKDVSFMDSSGIGVIIGRYKKISGEGGSVSVVNVNDRVKKIFNLSGMNKIINIYDTYEEVASSL